MVMQFIYLVLAIRGFALPYSQLIPFFLGWQNKLD